MVYNKAMEQKQYTPEREKEWQNRYRHWILKEHEMGKTISSQGDMLSHQQDMIEKLLKRCQEKSELSKMYS